MKYKPSECVGCGFCCSKSPCTVSVLLFGIPKPYKGCQALVPGDDRYYCDVVLHPEDYPIGNMDVAKNLAVGAGCCSALNTDRIPYLKK